MNTQELLYSTLKAGSKACKEKEGPYFAAAEVVFSNAAAKAKNGRLTVSSRSFKDRAALDVSKAVDKNIPANINATIGRLGAAWANGNIARLMDEIEQGTDSIYWSVLDGFYPDGPRNHLHGGFEGLD